MKKLICVLCIIIVIKHAKMTILEFFLHIHLSENYI